MSTSVENSASLSKDIFPSITNQNGERQSLQGNKNNWTNGLVTLNELDTSDDDDSKSTNSSSSSGISHSTTHNSAVISAQQNYYSSQIINNSSTHFTQPQFNEAETVYNSESQKHLKINTKNSSSNSSCNSKLSKSTTTSNFSMEHDDQDRDSCRSDDTDSPVGPPVDHKKISTPQTNSSSIPNYVNVPKDVNISEVLSDSGPDDIKSGKVIGANLSDEGNDDDSCDSRRNDGYNRISRDKLASR